MMGWSIGYDEKLKRDIGYGVPAICDHPECNNKIDRGIDYVCGGEPYGGDNGCGLHFCYDHLMHDYVCVRCRDGKEPFTPKPDVKEWVEWKLTDKSWQQWRDENKDEVERLRKGLED